MGTRASYTFPQIPASSVVYTNITSFAYNL